MAQVHVPVMMEEVSWRVQPFKQ